MSSSCFVCDEKVTALSADVSKVGEKGIASLKRASLERGDGKSHQIANASSLLVHTLCRKNYTRTQSISALKKQEASTSTQPETLVLRSALPKFDFHKNCLICGEFIQNETKKSKDKRRKVHPVRTLDFHKVCTHAATVRKDSWGEEVILRLAGVNDLVAEGGVYHNDCRLKFIKPLYAYEKSGSCSSEYVSKAMDDIYAFIDNSTDCQFSQTEILDAITGEKPVWKTIKAHLQAKYGSCLITSEGSNRFDVPVLCFLDTGKQILRDAWYEEKLNKESDERLRIVQKAAEIIRHDIQSKVCNDKEYPPTDDFFKDTEDLPESLLTFLESLMMNKTKRTQETKRKCVTIAHAITSVIRPRTFISSVLSGLSLFLHRKYGSRRLIDLLANMGFCATYHEAQILEMSALQNAQPSVMENSFFQFVFDNIDFNPCTINGVDSFHAMGGIKCIAPSTCVERSGSGTPRLTKMPTSLEIGKIGIIPLETLRVKEVGLQSVTVQELMIPDEPTHPNPFEVLWYIAKQQGLQLPAWKGYMQSITTGQFSEKTKVIPLPVINAPPSNYDTIYTALQYAGNSCGDDLAPKTLIVTFDQPLYWKAREIVASAPAGSLLSRSVIRLGGFHLLMSFLGAIGYLMSGSGLKELLSTIFAPLSVEKMMQGHAFARAVRGHLLATSSLATVILEGVQLTDDEVDCIKNMTMSFMDEPPSLLALNQNTHLKALSGKFGASMELLSSKGPTAQLWVQYFKMVSLMKEYIHAERSGDFNVHLDCVRRMIPYFHAAGHFPYAKSCHLYIQDMEKLHEKLSPEEYHKFVNNSYFTMRRSDRFWAGVWSDMTIETTLMRSFSSQGGMTRGRGVTDSTLSKWVVGMSATHDICTSLEEFSGVLFSTSEQHADFGQARQNKDAADIAKLNGWFEKFPPFPETSDIMSIATGVVGDTTITCYNAVAVGKQAMAKMADLDFSNIKLARKDRALPLSTVSSSIKINDEKIPVDPLLLFQRISISKKTDEDLKVYMEYELAPFPLALFNEGGMRKSTKSTLYKLFTTTTKDVCLAELDIVFDGGLLLHKVIWQRGTKISTICERYIHFITQNYHGRRCTVVFDGYSLSTSSTKFAEQQRRYRLSKSADIHFYEDTEINVKQEDFLSNKFNKIRLINILKGKLEDNGVKTLQAESDADVLIVDTAVKMSETTTVGIVGEDVDLIVLLMAKSYAHKDIIFIKPGRGKIRHSYFSSQELQEQGFKDVLFLHAFTGCDTTSSVFRKSKVAFAKLYLKSPDIKKAAAVFSDPSSTISQIQKAGETCMLRWYGAPAKEAFLNIFRYKSFLKSVANIKPDISCLPPTEGAVKQHSLRTFHQVQLWLGNDLSPQMYGWKIENNNLAPVHSELAAAPEDILKMVFCRCTKDCSSAKCGCKRANLKCSTACQNCQGNCLNGAPQVDSEDEEEQEDSQAVFLQMSDEEDIRDERGEDEHAEGPSRPKKARR